MAATMQHRTLFYRAATTNDMNKNSLLPFSLSPINSNITLRTYNTRYTEGFFIDNTYDKCKGRGYIRIQFALINRLVIDLLICTAPNFTRRAVVVH